MTPERLVELVEKIGKLHDLARVVYDLDDSDGKPDDFEPTRDELIWIGNVADALGRKNVTL